MDGAITIELLWKWLNNAAIAFFVVAFLRGWVVPRWVYDKVERDHARMADIAFRTIDVGGRAVSVAEKKVS